MFPRIRCFNRWGSPIRPNYFISKFIFSKDFIHNQPHMAIHSPVTVDIDTPIWSQEISHQRESLIDHRDEAIGSLPPGVTVGELLEYGWWLGELFISYLHLHREVSTHIERWIDIDELDPSCSLYLSSHGSVPQAREYQFVISPDELVRPAWELSSLLIDVK